MKKNRFQRILYVMMLFVFGLSLWPHDALALSATFTEDFSTTTYLDDPLSDAVWDTSAQQVSLPVIDWVHADTTVSGFENILPPYSNVVETIVAPDNTIHVLMGSGTSVNGGADVMYSQWNGSAWVKADGVTPGYDVLSSPTSTCIKNAGDLAIKSTGEPVVVWSQLQGGACNFTFGSMFVFYSEWDSGTSQWTTANGTPGSEIITPLSSQNRFPRLLLDSSDRPHVMFLNNTVPSSNRVVYYTVWDGVQWANGVGGAGSSLVSTGTTAARNAMMRLGADNLPQFTWQTASSNVLRYSKLNGTAFVQVDGTTPGSSIVTSSVAFPHPSQDLAVWRYHFEVDSSNIPHITWQGSAGGFYYAKGDPTSNSFVKADGSPGADTLTATTTDTSRHHLALTGDGRPAVAWTVSGAAYYREWSGASWTGADGVSVYDILDTFSYARDPRLDFDSADRPGVGWIDYTGLEASFNYPNGDACYTKWNGTAWRNVNDTVSGETCLNEATNFWWGLAGTDHISNLVFDSLDQPHIFGDFDVGITGRIVASHTQGVISLTHVAAATIVSTQVGTAPTDLLHYKLTPAASVPANTSIAYSISNDGGATWQSATPGVKESFTGPGTDLRWKADLSTTDASVTPVITGMTIVYDNVRSTSSPHREPAAPTIGTPVATSSTSINWTFTDNSTDEIAFELRHTLGAPIYMNGADLTGIEETGLMPNTEYSGRTVVAFNGFGGFYESLPAGAVFTFAETPGAVTATLADSSTAVVTFSAGQNPDYTRFAIQETQSGQWVQADGSLGPDPVWQTFAEWGSGSVTVSGLTAGTDYSFGVKARNGDLTETMMSASVLATSPTAPIPSGSQVLVVQKTVSRRPTVVGMGWTFGIPVSAAATSSAWTTIVPWSSRLLDLLLIVGLVACAVSVAAVVQLTRGKFRYALVSGHIVLLKDIFFTHPEKVYAHLASGAPIGSEQYKRYESYYNLTGKSFWAVIVLSLIKVGLIVLTVFVVSGNVGPEVFADSNGEAVYFGDELQYTVTVNNPSAADALDVVLTDTVPAGAAYVPGSLIVDAGSSGTFAAGAVSVTRSVLAAGGQMSASFTATVTGNAGTSIVNRAQATTVNTTAIAYSNETINAIAEIIPVPPVVPEIPVPPVTPTVPGTTPPGTPGAGTPTGSEPGTGGSGQPVSPPSGTTTEPTTGTTTPTPPAEMRVGVWEEAERVLTDPGYGHVTIAGLQSRIAQLNTALQGEVGLLSRIGMLAERTFRQAQIMAISIVASFIKSIGLLQVVVFDNPQVEQANRAVSLPVIGTLLVVNALLVYAASFSLASGMGSALWFYLQYFLFQPFSALAKRKRAKWGSVFDSVTGKPIDLAIIRLLTADTHHIVATRVTDKQGRFMFIADPGKYVLQLARNEYAFPSVIMAGKEYRGAMGNVYDGGVITVTEKTPVSYNIPVDPDRSLRSVKDEVSAHKKAALKYAASLIGAVLTLIAFMITPTILLGVLLAVQVGSWLIFRKLSGRHPLRNWGFVLHKDSKQALFQSVVRIFDTKYNKLLETQVTDRRGRYGFLVSPNTYKVTAEKVGFEKYESPAIPIKNAKGGIVKETIPLKKA